MIWNQKPRSNLYTNRRKCVVTMRYDASREKDPYKQELHHSNLTTIFAFGIR